MDDRNNMPPWCTCTIRIRGTVQGVGFRPFVYRLAKRLDVRGSVKNDAEGVLIECFGGQAVIERFAVLLHEEAPVLSIVKAVDVSSITPCRKNAHEFHHRRIGKGRQDGDRHCARHGRMRSVPR
jgi:hydrogenase maturation factor HypF (carbamoyltransferase family)